MDRSETTPKEVEHMDSDMKELDFIMDFMKDTRRVRAVLDGMEREGRISPDDNEADVFLRMIQEVRGEKASLAARVFLEAAERGAKERKAGERD